MVDRVEEVACPQHFLRGHNHTHYQSHHTSPLPPLLGALQGPEMRSPHELVHPSRPLRPVPMMRGTGGSGPLDLRHDVPRGATNWLDLAPFSISPLSQAPSIL